MNKKLIITAVGSAVAGVVASPVIIIGIGAFAFRDAIRVSKSMKETRGLGTERFTEIMGDKLSDDEANEFIKLKAKELKGKKLKKDEFDKLFQMETKLFGEFSNVVN